MDESGAVLVKMLYNEKEVHFKPDCKNARIAPQSFFYVFEKLKACMRRRFPAEAATSMLPERLK